jgi:hypothetical protein
MRTVFIFLIVCVCKLAQGQTLPEIVADAAQRHELSTTDLLSIMQVESSGGKNASTQKNRNGTIDVGPMQVNSVHAAGLCRGLKLLTQTGNVECAARLLKKHEKHALTDPMWVARYHSRTPSIKAKYYRKLQRAQTLLAQQ